eukprot:1364446-Amorphochlora_amoeboformis.AAC.2
MATYSSGYSSDTKSSPTSSPRSVTMLPVETCSSVMPPASLKRISKHGRPLEDVGRTNNHDTRRRP